MGYVQANTDGRLHAADQPSIAPLNRGFLYGDAVYEVWRTYERVIFAWEEHWSRLERSAAALYFEIPWSAEVILTEIRKTVAAFRTQVSGARDVYIRLQISRGGGAIGLDPALSDVPSFVILVQENALLPSEKLERGLRLSLARALRRNPANALNPAWKTGNYLNNILCLREARSRGADEVVITNHAGAITEAAVSNIGFIQAGRLVTPPLDVGILAGITRAIILERVAPATGVEVAEAAVRPEDLPTFDECFLLSSTKDITPVAAIDDVRFTVSPYSATARLKRAFLEYASDCGKRNAGRLTV